MTILGIFLNNTMRTGANRRYLELMESLAEHDNQVFVIMNTDFDYTPQYFTKIPLSVRYKRKGFPPASFLFKRTVQKQYATIGMFISEQNCPNIDWIHIHGDMHLKCALYLKKRFGAKLFFAFRCNDITRAHLLRKSGSLSVKDHLFSCLYEPINRFREKIVAKNAELVAFQNTVDRNLFCKRTHCSKEGTVVIPGNIGLPRCTPEWENTNNCTALTSLVYAGGVTLTKGLYDMFKALALIKKQIPQAPHLYVLGRAEKTELAAAELAAAELDIAELVSYEGYVNPPFPFFAKASLLVYPTLYDAFPDTVLEALHCGCPVIASRIGGLPDILEHQELLFETGNSAEIAHKITVCIKNPDQYHSVRRLCRERTGLFHFNWSQKWIDAMNLYKE